MKKKHEIVSTYTDQLKLPIAQLFTLMQFYESFPV